MKFVLPLLIFFQTFSVRAETITLEESINDYFKEKKIDWTLIKNNFRANVNEWDLGMNNSNFGEKLWLFFGEYEKMVQPIQASKGVNLAMAELDKLGDFHADPPNFDEDFSWENIPKSWWQEVLGNTKFDQSFNPELFQYLKRRSIEGRIDPITIGFAFNIGLTPQALENEGLQKLTVCMIYPFMLPTAQNLIADSAEVELQNALDKVFGTDGWDQVESSLLEHIYSNPDYKEENMLRKGDKFRFMLDHLGSTGFFKKWENDGVRQSLEDAGLVKNGQNEWGKIKDLLEPVITKYGQRLHRFHPISGAYSIVESLIEINDEISVSIKADGCKINFSEVDLEQRHFQQLLVILMAENFLYDPK